MGFIAESRRNQFWFGTEEWMQWFPTPNSGADMSPSGWSADGTLLNGGGFQLGSFGSHKRYVFEWPSSSSRQVAQMMKSYSDGTFGRGLIYFLDPLIYNTNVLPAMWADPSMGVGFEGASLVSGIAPTPLPTSNWQANSLPVQSAYYDLSSVAAGWRGKEEAVFIPVPEEYTLSLGSFHQSSGSGGVFYREQSRTGALGPVVPISGMSNDSQVVVNTTVSGANLAGVWLFVGKSSAGSASVTLTAMTGRIIRTLETVSTKVATNLFTNPNLVGDGTWAEVRRNLFKNPAPVGNLGWASQAGWSFVGEVDGWAEAEKITSTSAGGTYPIGSGAGSGGLAAVVPGATYTFSVEVLSEVTLQIGLTANWRNSSGSQIAITGTTSYMTVPANTPTVLTEVLEAPEPAAFAGCRALLQGGQDVPLGTKFRARRMYVGTAGSYFDGSTMDNSMPQPEDFRVRWLGTPNASESVMEIERVRELTSVNNLIVGKSTKNGKPAARGIPSSSSSSASFVNFNSLTPSNEYTVVATTHLDAPLSGALNTYSRTVGVGWTGGNYSQSTQAPNEPGSTSLRHTATAGSPGPSARLYHGGQIGSGDVWWTDIGLFAGDYTGQAFSGDSGSVVINGRNHRTQWDGPPDNSTSSAWTLTPSFDKLKQGPWVGGQGHSGARFSGPPTYVANTGVGGGQISFAASFTEVGSWLHG